MTTRRLVVALRCGAGVLGWSTLAGCTVGPDYHRPDAVPMPAAWTTEAPWRPAQPDDAALRGDWWTLFGDSQLTALVAQALAQNQTLQVAVSRLEQARLQVQVTQAALLPEVDASASLARSKSSADRPLSSYTVPNVSTTQNDARVGVSVSYEADLFGRVRREVEGIRASAGQAAADFENTRLLLTADVVANYCNLRELDAEIDVVRQGIVLQRHALDYIVSRHDLGVASGLDLAQQEAVVETSETQLRLLQNQRAQTEHTLATLVGAAAPAFAIAADPTTPPVPVPPIGVPSDVLQRRPDVASSERAMQVANARIGVARAAYYPSVTLQPNLGWDSNSLSKLFNAPSLLWSLGVSATQVVFDAGRRDALTRIAQADYAGTVATYRQTVLTAMQEVENGVTGLADLGLAADHAQSSVRSTQRALDLANDRYAGGLATYLDVITAQQTLLSGQRQVVQIEGQRLQSAVYLIKALGGGWQAPEAVANVATPTR